MDIDRERNCYSCRGFEHLVRNYRNREIMEQERRLEYGDNSNTKSNLNKEENVLN